MQTENNIFEELKMFYKTGGTVIRLIFINVLVFLGIAILEVVARLLGAPANGIIAWAIYKVFALPSGFNEFIIQPWTLFTSIFTHFGFWHLLMNMLYLYFSGRMFLTAFTGKRLVYTYVLGGLFGGLLEILARYLFNGIDSSGPIVGASGAIMAVMVAIAFHRPRLLVSFFGLFQFRFVILVGIFVLQDILSLGINDNVAHFAHLGGAVLGLLSIQNIYSRGNIITITQNLIGKIGHFFSVLFRPTKTPKMKVKKGGTRTQQFKTDEQYNKEANDRQEKIDAILDKISRSGYESLTKSEKDFLFKQSNK